MAAKVSWIISLLQEIKLPLLRTLTNSVTTKVPISTNLVLLIRFKKIPYSLHGDRVLKNNLALAYVPSIEQTYDCVNKLLTYTFDSTNLETNQAVDSSTF